MELPHPCISPLELGSGVLLNQCMHACNACGASPFLCNYLITRCDVILTLGHISRWNTVKIETLKSGENWLSNLLKGARSSISKRKASGWTDVHIVHMSLLSEATGRLATSMKRIRDGDLAMGHARKPQEDQCFLINNHFDRYSAITSASHHASIEFFGPLVLRRKICALCGHGDFRDIQVASGRWQLPVNLRPVQWGARLLQHATVQLWATHFKHL